MVQNYSAAEPMRQKFAGLLSSITGMTAFSKKVTVPFSEAQFDPSGIEAARAAINERLFGDVDFIVLPTSILSPLSRRLDATAPKPFRPQTPSLRTTSVCLLSPSPSNSISNGVRLRFRSSGLTELTPRF